MIEESCVSVTDKEFGLMAIGAVSHLRVCGQKHTEEILDYLTPKLKYMTTTTLKEIYDTIVFAYTSGKCGVCRNADRWDEFMHAVEVALCSRQCVNSTINHCARCDSE